MDKPRVKPLVWEYHPAGTIAVPSTGHSYIIDTRMKGRVYSVKGFNPQREFESLIEAKAAAQADYEARILAALEPAPVSVREAAQVLLEAMGPKDLVDESIMDLFWDGSPFTALRALAEKGEA